MNIKIYNDKYIDLSTRVATCFKDCENVSDWRQIEVSITESGSCLVITIWQMYEYLPLTHNVLERLSDVFGTRDYTVDSYNFLGCETCDYGSKYEHVFVVSKDLISSVA